MRLTGCLLRHACMQLSDAVWVLLLLLHACMHACMRSSAAVAGSRVGGGLNRSLAADHGMADESEGL